MLKEHYVVSKNKIIALIIVVISYVTGCLLHYLTTIPVIQDYMGLAIEATVNKP